MQREARLALYRWVFFSGFIVLLAFNMSPILASFLIGLGQSIPGLAHGRVQRYHSTEIAAYLKEKGTAVTYGSTVQLDNSGLRCRLKSQSSNAVRFVIDGQPMSFVYCGSQDKSEEEAVDLEAAFMVAPFSKLQANYDPYDTSASNASVAHRTAGSVVECGDTVMLIRISASGEGWDYLSPLGIAPLMTHQYPGAAAVGIFDGEDISRVGSLNNFGLTIRCHNKNEVKWRFEEPISFSRSETSYLALTRKRYSISEHGMENGCLETAFAPIGGSSSSEIPDVAKFLASPVVLVEPIESLSKRSSDPHDEL